MNQLMIKNISEGDLSFLLNVIMDMNVNYIEQVRALGATSIDIVNKDVASIDFGTNDIVVMMKY